MFTSGKTSCYPQICLHVAIMHTSGRVHVLLFLKPMMQLLTVLYLGDRLKITSVWAGSRQLDDHGNIYSCALMCPSYYEAETIILIDVCYIERDIHVKSQ